MRSRAPRSDGTVPKNRFESPIPEEIDFFNEIGFKARILDDWGDYDLRGRTSPLSLNCRKSNARGWFPTEADWVADGVTGIAEFWYPTTPEDEQIAASRVFFRREEMAFINREKVLMLCFDSTVTGITR